jgi:hypothetical protein
MTTQVFAQAALYNVTDGSLNDWGVTPGYDWTPNPGIFYTLEDYLPGSNRDGYLDPGWGGQTFDAEAMYLNYDNNYLYYAIVTGMPKGGNSGLLPGDIAISFNNEGFEYGIAVPNYNSYVLPTRTNGRVAPVTAPKDGALYRVDPALDTSTDDNGWIWSGWSDPEDIVPLKIYQYGGTMANGKPGAQYLASGQFSYKNYTLSASLTGTGRRDTSHWIIEGYVPISAFGDDWGKPLEMLWTETCGNDIIRGQLNVVPEPSTMLLLGLGLVGIVGKKLRNRRK